MRWLLDILHYSRDRESVSGIPLNLVFDTRRPCSPEPYDSHRKHSERKTCSSGSNGKIVSHVIMISSMSFIAHLQIHVQYQIIHAHAHQILN